MTKKKPNFGSPVLDVLKKESTKKNKEQKNFGISSCGYKRTAEITLNLKTARLIQQIFKNKWSVNWRTRQNLERCLSDHIEACDTKEASG